MGNSFGSDDDSRSEGVDETADPVQSATFKPSCAGGSILGMGYEGQDLPSFLAAVTAAGIEVLIDIRLNPMSRKRGFSKRALTESLAGIGVVYRHEPALGNPKTNRPGFTGPADEWSAARARYQQLLSAPAAQDALARIAQTTLTSRTAVLCFEADQRHCHRDVVLTQLSDLPASEPLAAAQHPHL
jgi:uncharacterized protein (DUF488 family)